MLNYNKTQVKRKNIFQIQRGDVIRYNYILYVFVRIPNGVSSIYVKTLESKFFKIRLRNHNDTFDVIGFCEEILRPDKNDINDLKEGELFVIDYKPKGSFVYRFERWGRYGETIIAVNPINNKEVRISKGFTCTKIDNLPF